MGFGMDDKLERLLVELEVSIGPLDVLLAELPDVDISQLLADVDDDISQLLAELEEELNGEVDLP